MTMIDRDEMEYPKPIAEVSKTIASRFQVKTVPPLKTKSELTFTLYPLPFYPSPTHSAIPCQSEVIMIIIFNLADRVAKLLRFPFLRRPARLTTKCKF